MIEEQMSNLIDELGDHVEALRESDPTDLPEVYRKLGLRFTSKPQNQQCGSRRTSIPHNMAANRSVSEGRLEPNAHPLVLTRSFLLGSG